MVHSFTTYFSKIHFDIHKHLLCSPRYWLCHMVNHMQYEKNIQVSQVLSPLQASQPNFFRHFLLHMCYLILIYKQRSYARDKSSHLSHLYEYSSYKMSTWECKQQQSKSNMLALL